MIMSAVNILFLCPKIRNLLPQIYGYNPMNRINVFLLAAALSLLAVSCASNAGDNTVASYSEEIKNTDPITFNLYDAISFKATDETKAVLKQHITISPAVDFDVEVAGPQMVILKPKAPLAYNTTYRVTANFGKAAGVSDGKGEFNVHTLAPIIVYNFSQLKVDKEKSDHYSVLVGISSQDVLDGKYLESGFIAKGTSCNTVWEHSEDGRSHTLSVRDIAAGTVKSNFQITYNLPEYASEGGRSYVIPKAKTFMVMDSQVTLEPYGFKIAFSSMLSPKQDFKTLVTVPGGGRLSFIVDDNILKISPAVKADKQQFVNISKLIMSASGARLDEDFEACFSIPSGAPSVKFLTSGSIIPSSVGTDLAFQAINYAKVRVRVKRIYENNILQFMQSNSISDKYSYTDNVARVVADTTFALAPASSPKLHEMTVYGINLAKLVKVQNGAIYRVEIRGVDPLVKPDEDVWESEYYFGAYEDYKSRVLNILVSDIGVIAKGSDRGEYSIYAVNLMSASPISGAKVSVCNGVNQVIAEGSTSSSGKFTFKTDDEPRTVVVMSGGDKSYLAMGSGVSLSLSNFDVGGNASRDGQKGYIFGERGVWRPGDDVHITFVSMLDEGVLPDNHPVTAVLRNPQGQIMSTLVSNRGSSGMYSFIFPTERDAPTGNWEVSVTAGGQTFSKTVKIETVKPNNIIIGLDLADSKAIPAKSVKGDISAKWLVGNPAANLETRVEVSLSKGKTKFDGYEDYVFEDASRAFQSETREIFKGTTSSTGKTSFSVAMATGDNAPGMLSATFTTRVFEQSGDFSIDRCSATISPYSTYLGINAPVETNSWGEEYIDKDKVSTFNIVAVDRNGKPVTGKVNFEVEVYRMGWSWWWSSSSDRLASYAKDSYNDPFSTKRYYLSAGKGSFKLDLTKEDSGFFFIRVTDLDGGHAASTVVMLSRSWESSSDGNSNSAVKLPMNLDKDKYTPGETANLEIASALGAKALVSIEKGQRMLDSYWVDCKGTTTRIPIKIGEGMAPDVYVSVTLVQPYDRTANDAPIRMFGVRRINVDDPSTHLYPVIDIDSEVKPESDVTFTVKEKNGRPMSYVVALVDEGLLSLTRFKTPNPWNSFYATEALGVRTWDLYNLVVGAYGAQMEQLFAIGGDGETGDVLNPDSHAERFKPVSIFLGPFSVKARSSQKHTVQIPQYIGNLRAMVIATDGTRMGSSDKNVSVTKPVMVKATLPRIMGTDETVLMPVTVFTAKDGAGKVTVEISAEGGLEIDGAHSATVDAPKSGEYMAFFNLKASSKSGMAKVTSVAKGGGDSSTETIEIDVRDSNPVTTSSMTALLESGKTTRVTCQMAGMPGSNKVKVEASVIPPIDMDFRLDYLTSYPHGCLEQTISAAFPQLYVGSLVDLDRNEIARCEANVKAAIKKMNSFAIASGGMTYWPGTASYSGAHVWATVYATHFMQEAKNCGYAVPASLMKSNLKFLETVASGKSYDAVSRCYACYVLALAGSPSRSQMNRLREMELQLPESCAWYLAAAYAADGKKDVARSIVEKITPDSERYNLLSNTFDSNERTLAVASIVYGVLDEKVLAFKSIEKLSDMLNDRKYYMSTQSTAWALKAVADYMKANETGSVDVTVRNGSDNVALKSDKSLAQGILSAGNQTSMTLEVTNAGKSPAYVVVSSKGIPEKGMEEEKSNGLRIVNTFTDVAGNSIDPNCIPQGTDFYLNTYIANTSQTVDYTNLALVQIFPSGWEIHVNRTDNFYQDVRDDRVCSYFDLGRASSFVVRTRLTATYKGRFYMPSMTCEAMYDVSIGAATKGSWVEVR